MNWILPAILSTLVGTVAISLVYTFLFLNEKKDYLGIWAAGWWLYAVRFVFSFLIQKYSPSHLFISIEQSASLLSGIFLLHGTLLFLGKKSIKKWLFICIALQLWIIISILFHYSYIYITLPTFLFLGIIYIETGIIFFRDHTINNAEHKAAGLTFILWGIHKMNYPFLRTVIWFAPVGFFMGTLFEFIIAFSFIFIYYKKNKEDLIKKVNEINGKSFLLSETQKISHTGSWELNVKENRLTWSDETYRIFGIKDKSKELNYELFMTMVHPEDIKKVNDTYMQSLEQNKDSYELEHRIINRETGDTRIVFEKCIHMRDDYGKVINSIGIVQDITEIKLQEEEKKEFERKMFQIQKMESIGQLSGGIAHDFNNQLAAIMGYSELLKKKLDDPQLIKYIDKMIKVLENSSLLTRQLLSFARKGNYNKKTINIVNIVDDVIDILNHSVDKRITTERKFDLHDAYINGDYTNIQNAVLNIALNSRDAIEGKGKILFQITSEAFDRENNFENGFLISPGNYIKLKIIDTGYGMNKETLGRIFEPFFTTKTVGKGTGMGLASVFGIIKSHNGAIEVKSELNKGTEFSLYLPCIENSSTGMKDPEIFSIRENFQKKLSVLIIDDNMEFAEVLKEHLEQAGHNARIFNSGTSGIEYFFEKYRNTDIVVLDYMMPDMTGKEVYDELKLIKPDQKFILSSGYNTNENDIVQMINEGCIPLNKPFSIKEFNHILNDFN